MKKSQFLQCKVVNLSLQDVIYLVYIVGLKNLPYWGSFNSVKLLKIRCPGGLCP